MDAVYMILLGLSSMAIYIPILLVREEIEYLKSQQPTSEAEIVHSNRQTVAK